MQPGAPRRIVVADDNEDSAQSFAMLLSFSGHEVCIAHDGAEALNALRDFRPDVAFLDIGMPGLTGYDLLHKLREQTHQQRRRTPAIALTAFAGQRDEALQAGFDAYMVKPFETEVLVGEVERLALEQNRD